MYSKPFVLFGLVWGFVVVCGCGSENTPPAESSQDVGDVRVDAVVDAGPQDGGGEDAPDVPLESLEIVLELDRDRTDGLSDILATVSVLRDGELVEDVVPEIEADLGVLTPVEFSSETRTYRFRLSPDQTGEHPITVRVQGVELQRTAVVLRDLPEGIGQPMSVPGLVNTPGYEDGVTITPDGQYLFVQTGPAYFSGLIAFQIPREQGGCGGNRLNPDVCDHPWVNQTIGSYDAPERPGFFTGRIDTGTGTFTHGSNLYQVPEGAVPTFPIPTMFYGFARQPDGTFADPFFVAFEDEDDAIVNPFGLSFMMHGDGTATILFSMLDPSGGLEIRGVDDNMDGEAAESVNSVMDVYTTRIVLGEDNVLGRFEPGAQALEVVRGEGFQPQPLGFSAVGSEGHYGTQGNAHLYQGPQGEVISVWTDDEFDRDPSTLAHEDYHDLSVYVLDGTFPEGPWTKVVLPDVVNTDEEQIQPFFTGDGLIYTQDTNLYFSAYVGEHTAEGYGNADNWGVPVAILRKDTTAEVGRVIAIGEPTVGFYDGRAWLYFVYGRVRSVDERTGFPDLDLNAGFVAIDP